MAGYNRHVHRPINRVFDDNHVIKNPIPVERALHGFDRVAPASIDTLLSQLGCGPRGASKTSYWHNESRQFLLSKWKAAVPRLRRTPCSLFLEQNAFNHCDGRHNSRESSVDIPTLERKMQMPLRLTIATPLLDIEAKWMLLSGRNQLAWTLLCRHSFTKDYRAGVYKLHIKKTLGFKHWDKRRQKAKR